MIEKGIKGGICYPIHRYVKASNKYIKNYDYLNYVYLGANNLYGWAMSQTFLVDGFKWKKYVKI